MLNGAQSCGSDLREAIDVVSAAFGLGRPELVPPDRDW